MSKTKSLTIWFAVNKSGFIGLYYDEPTRNEETGKWDSKFPFVNSIIYDQIVKLVEKSNITWKNDAECLTLNF